MEYILSQERDNKKKQYESKIEQKNKKYMELAEEIKNIRKGNEGTLQDRSFMILELQIKQEEIEREIGGYKQAITNLYVSEMVENLTHRRMNQEISTQEFSNERKNIREYRGMVSSKNSIEDYDNEANILEMKLRLEHMKKRMGKIPKEQADKNIVAMKQELSNNEEYRQTEVDELCKQNFEYKKRNLCYQRNIGEISTEEFKQKLEELEQTKNEIPTEKEFAKRLNDLTEKHLEQPQQTQEYQKEVSSRGEDSKYCDATYYSYEREKAVNQNINKWHERSIYCGVREFDTKVGNNIMFALENEDPIEYAGKELGKEYARGAKGEKAELAKQFAMIEVQGQRGDFLDPYTFEQIEGGKKPKLLLQLEKVNGLNIEELEDTIGLDTSALHQDIFVATYEIEEWDKALGKTVMKSVKEYYQRDENGDFDIIGTGTENETTFVIDGVQLDVGTEQVLQGDILEKVTQKEMGDRLIKNTMEDSLKNGKVTEVATITDDSFLRDFKEQCGLPENWDLGRRTFIISTINEKGEEDFGIVVRKDSAYKEDGKLGTKYEHLMGIKATNESGREISTTTGRQMIIPGVGKMSGLNKTQTLKEFRTKSGHRYAITRNSEGKLGFNEIFRENENIIRAQHIDAYTYSTEDLIKIYENKGINQEDLNKAYETISRTKEEREQTHNKAKTNHFEGR